MTSSNRATLRSPRRMQAAFRGLYVSFLVLAALPAAAAPAAEVASVEGKGEYREANQAAWRTATLKQALFPTNFVRTLDLSKMAIVFADRTQVRLAPNSVLQIKEVATGPDTRTIINLNAGRSWTQSKTTPKGLVMETPSALAAIRGTDWEMVVDPEGRATLSVFSGEVEFYNDQGNVVVGPNEQARAERGKAPVKLQLQTSRERVQWVSAFSVDTLRYAEFRAGAPADLAPVATAIREQRLGDAYAGLQRRVAAADAPAAAWLLLADFEIYRGELGAARDALRKGASRFASDERFDAGLARVALLADDAAAALGHANAALAKRGESTEALIVLGDIERQQGRAPQALDAYARATRAAASDARGWYGLGAVEGERENVGRARSNLARAIALDDKDATYRAELGTLEGFAGNLALGRETLGKAIAMQPDNYVALTGLGVLELKAGNVEAALDALLRASVIEPRYARAHVYLAAAYYQAGRDEAALEELRRASEFDPRDPLPHMLRSIIHLDRIEPGEAVVQARAALERIPFLKSLNQVADNQKGLANVGSPLAFMGLEAWARSAAHESYLPFWGGSHLFLADRYAGEFDRRSELMQGFITDPLVFGASNRFQSLLGGPGHHGTLSMRYNASDDLRLVEPVLTLNGYDVSRFPAAYFVEAVDTRIEPRNTALSARARTFTVAAGGKPSHELGVFVYANRLSVDADFGSRGANGVFAQVGGSASRIDAGMRYAFDAASSLWLKAGASREDSSVDDVLAIEAFGLAGPSRFVQQSHFTTRPRGNDVAARYTLVRNDRLELTMGTEWARVRTVGALSRDESLHFEADTVPRRSLDERDVDRSRSVYAIARWGGPDLRVDAGLAWRDYRKSRDFVVNQHGGSVSLQEDFERRNADPLLGVTWRMAPSSLARAACRRWLRPAGLDTLAPVAVAGVPLDDQLVFAGGVLEQCRGQWEWTVSERTFVTAAVERSRTRNLASPLDGVLNTRADVSNLERLRNRALAAPAKPDLLEEIPVYAEGIARRASLAMEGLVTRSLGVSAHYTYTDSENTAALHSGLRIPYLPRHQAHLGLAWAPGWRTFVTAQAVYRSRRFADEANLQALRSGWDVQANAFVETGDKRWALEAYAANLLKKDASDVFGIVLSYRF
jgi:tetratricopeptide (TPR) repeat protein